MTDEPRRFFVDEKLLRAKNVTLTGDLAHRLAKVLRYRRGDRIVLSGGGPRDFVVELTSISGNGVTGLVVGEQPAPRDPTVEVVLYQSLIRANRFDWVLEKATEIGVTRFVPVIATRVQLQLEEGAARAERWKRLIIEAAEQCERGKLPTIDAPVSFDDAVARAPGLKLMPWEDEQQQKLGPYLRTLPQKPRTVSVFIGPEGGYEQSEVDLARESGAVLVTLGRQVMRAETAAIVACGIVLHELDG
ncbi:MAG: 16S rRNA (uracil(1498)-N(3))-methyltransferase [Chloroflexota bacterium]